MYARFLKKPSKSILLFGPRGTGKSTWIRQNFPKAILYDLLDTAEVLRLSKEPGIIYRELKEQKPNTLVIIDEVQKVPDLLNEVHRLIENHKLNFILSGSSARKLKRGASNLLAGRAITTHLYPLVSAEVDFDIQSETFFTHGMLPLSFTSQDPTPYLTSYVETYLNEEIKAEALTRNIGAFARFLEIAARQNGQVTNISNIARDAMIERKTVENYFQILVDTLIGDWLPAWKLKSSNKQISHPKFYFFDSGVARALSGRLPYPPTQEELGPLIETSILNEIRAYISYHNLYYKIYFWQNYNNIEVDIVFETKNGFVAIEIKAAKQWYKKFNKGLIRIQKEFGHDKVKCYGIYQGERQAHFDNVNVLPTLEFLKLLWENKIF